MSNIKAHELHQMVRSWLLAEDPYGVNQRQEPTFDMPTGSPAAPAAGRSPIAQAAGEGAVANATAPDPRGQTAGPQAVEKQLFGGHGASTSESGRNAAYPDRASTQGESAVARATAPSPTAEVDRTRGQMWGEDAVDKALSPPTGGGGGFWMPGEAADTASAVGEQAVAGSLASKARGKMARGRLKDPQDPDDRQPD